MVYRIPNGHAERQVSGENKKLSKWQQVPAKRETVSKLIRGGEGRGRKVVEGITGGSLPARSRR